MHYIFNIRLIVQTGHVTIYDLVKNLVSIERTRRHRAKKSKVMTQGGFTRDAKHRNETWSFFG